MCLLILCHNCYYLENIFKSLAAKSFVKAGRYLFSTDRIIRHENLFSDRPSYADWDSVITGQRKGCAMPSSDWTQIEVLDAIEYFLQKSLRHLKQDAGTF